MNVIVQKKKISITMSDEFYDWLKRKAEWKEISIAAAARFYIRRGIFSEEERDYRIENVKKPGVDEFIVFMFPGSLSEKAAEDLAASVKVFGFNPEQVKIMCLEQGMRLGEMDPITWKKAMRDREDMIKGFMAKYS